MNKAIVVGVIIVIIFGIGIIISQNYSDVSSTGNEVSVIEEEINIIDEEEIEPKKMVVGLSESIGFLESRP
ncbi:hypothetical protein [Nitrosopumilus adriaticus]|uniref:hypothetical protein n=1 Tax=Nitrosopumilus adriaticus TaxID=1580092 RepID=UPI00352D0FAF